MTKKSEIYIYIYIYIYTTQRKISKALILISVGYLNTQGNANVISWLISVADWH
jgi:hypothetical protein